MGSGPNCDGNGKKMGITATDGGCHIVTATENKKILNLFVVAVAV